MNLDRRTSVAALTAAGLLWGTTVPVTKLALGWLPPGWLTVARFGLAAAVLLVAVRFRVRAVCSPAVLAWGTAGYGGSILVQNAGITRTSVTRAALLIGATPVLVAVIAAVRHRRAAQPVAWTGFALSFAGVGLVAGGGAGATFTGDGLVLASLVFSASFTVAQAGLLPGRDPVAVTAVQFLAAAIAALPVAAVTEGPPAATAGVEAVAATAGLALAGTLAPATLFAYGQARVSAETAGAFVNLEPLVGAATGAAVFGDPVGTAQAAGGAAILTGIALSSLPLLLATSVGQPGDQAGVGDVAEEPAGGDAPARLGLEGRGGILADPAGGDEGVGAPVDDRRGVAGVPGLDIAEAPHAHRLQARLLQQHRQPSHQPRVVHAELHEGRRAGLQRVAGVQGHGGGGVVAVEHRQPAAGPQDPSGLGEGQVGTGHMAQRGMEHHHVEALVLEVQGPGVALQRRTLAGGCSRRAAARNVGEGSTPVTSATPGQAASSRVTAPVPQPTSSTRAPWGKPMSPRYAWRIACCWESAARSSSTSAIRATSAGSASAMVA
jgi:O-acetylserine/cysteine efflux transporter